MSLRDFLRDFARRHIIADGPPEPSGFGGAGEEEPLPYPAPGPLFRDTTRMLGDADEIVRPMSCSDAEAVERFLATLGPVYPDIGPDAGVDPY